MSVQFRPSTPDDLPGIVQLLQSAFNAPADAPYLDRTLLSWKYFEAGPEWDGSRSYVLAQEDRLVAHACAWPVRIVSRTGLHMAICLLDWASARELPGMGMMLARKLAQLAPIALSIGGSDMTRQIMPRIGFRQKGELLSYARVLRPWLQFRTRPSEPPPKSLLRLARNAVWSMRPTAWRESWSARPLASADNAVSGVGQPGSIHHADLLDFVLRCPGARVTAFDLLRLDTPRGYLVLSRVGGQSRIADLRICSDTLGEWKSAYAAAVETAKQDRDAAELIAVGSDSVTIKALEDNGFFPRDRRPVFVSDPQHRIPEEDYPLHLDMLDDDLSYLNIREQPYLT